MQGMILNSTCEFDKVRAMKLVDLVTSLAYSNTPVHGLYGIESNSYCCSVQLTDDTVNARLDAFISIIVQFANGKLGGYNTTRIHSS